MRFIYVYAPDGVDVAVVKDHNSPLSLLKEHKPEAPWGILSLVNNQSDLLDLAKLLEVLSDLLPGQLGLETDNENFSLFFVEGFLTTLLLGDSPFYLDVGAVEEVLLVDDLVNHHIVAKTDKAEASEFLYEG